MQTKDNIAKNIKVLVIDDEESLREDIIEILRYENYEVFGTGDGISGLRMVNTHRPDIIICDIMMPEMDGYGVLMELRSDPATATIPLIFLTAKTSRADTRRGMVLGADDFVPKPFTQEELTEAVRAQLHKKQTQAREVERVQAEMENLRQNFVRALPHELRTPLTAIFTYSGMLDDEVEELDKGQIRQMAQGIEKAAHRLHNLAENYLAYAQLELIQSDQQRIAQMRQSIELDADVIVHDVASKKAYHYERINDFHLNLSAVNLRIDGEGLEKIVTEITDNAFKFSHPGERVWVKGQVEGDEYVVTICNEGRGIAPEHIDWVGAYMQFERRIYEQSGLGLGLIIARRLSEFYGGSLTIESEAGVDTCVTLRLLMAPDQAAPQNL